MNKPEVSRAQLERVIGRLFDEIQATKRSVASVQRAQDTKHTVLLPGESIKQLGENGEVVAEIGGNSGSVVKHVDGPVPAQPEAPEVEAQEGQLTVIVDGYDVDGEAAPEDLARTIVHYSREDGFDAYQGTSKGTITGASGQKVFGVAAGTWYVRVQWETLAGKLSAPSEQVMVEIDPPVDAQDIQDTLDAAEARLDTYRDEVAAPRFQALEDGLSESNDNLADARTRLSAAEQTLSPLPGRIESAERDVETAKEAAESAEARAVEASNNAGNRLQNGGFELGLDHWDATNVTLSDDAHTGNQAALIGAGGALRPDASIPVSEGDVWDVSAYAKNGSALVVDVLNAADDAVLESFSTPMGSTWSETGRQRVEIPAGVDYMNIRITGDSTLVDDVVLRDVTDVVRLERAATLARQTAEQAIADLEVLQLAVDGEGGLRDRLDTAEITLQDKADTSELNQLDEKLASNLAAIESHYTKVWRRSTPPPPGTSYEWAGERHASESIKKVDGVEVARNLAHNPRGAGTSGTVVVVPNYEGTESPDPDFDLVGGNLVAPAPRRGTASNGVLYYSRTRNALALRRREEDPDTGNMYVLNLGHTFDEGEPVAISVEVWSETNQDEFTMRSYINSGTPPGNYRTITGGHGVIVETGTSNSNWVPANFTSSYLSPGDTFYIRIHKAIGNTEAAALAQVETYFDGSTPSDRAHDLWYNTEGVPHEWVNGQGWVELTDARLGQIADDAKQYADTQDAIVKAEAATDAQTKADQAKNDAETAAATHADLVAQDAEQAAIEEAERLHSLAVAEAEAAQQRANEAHDEAGSAWSHADAAMNRAVTAESNAIAQARAELAALEVGSRNLLRDSTVSVTTDAYLVTSLDLGDNPPQEGDTVTLSIKGQLGEDRVYWMVYNSGGSVRVRDLDLRPRDQGDDGVYRLTGTWHVGSASNTFVSIYAGLNTGTSESTIEWVKLEKGSKATDWTPAPEDIQARIDQAQAAAQAHADNLPKSLGGTTPPAGTAPDGSVWRQRDATNTIIARWERIDGAWVPQQVSGEVIDNLEAGKITALYTEFAESVIGTIWGQLGVFDRLEAREGWVGGVNLADGAVTAEKIEASREVITRIMGAEWAYISERLVVEGDLIANHADVISAAIQNLSVTERADLFEAFITTLGAQEAVIDLLIGTEAWIGGTMLKDDTITTQHIEFTETLVGNIAELLHLVVDRIDVNSLWADQTWQAAGHFGSEDADQQTRVDGTGVALYRKVDGEFIPAAVFGGGDLQLSFFDDDGESTGTITRDGRVSGAEANFEHIAWQGRSLVGDHPPGEDGPLLDNVTQAFIARNTAVLNNDDLTGQTQPALLGLKFEATAGFTYEIWSQGFRLYPGEAQPIYAAMHYTTQDRPATISDPILGEEVTATSPYESGTRYVADFTRYYHATETGTVNLLLSVRRSDGGTIANWVHDGRTVDVMVRPAGTTPPIVDVSESYYVTGWWPSWHQVYENGARYTGGSDHYRQGHTSIGGATFATHLGGFRSTNGFGGGNAENTRLAPAVAGARIQSGQLRLTGVSNAESSGGPVTVYWHTHTSTPTTFTPPTSQRLIGTYRVAAGQRTNIDLPQETLDAIQAGTLHGFTLYDPTGDVVYVSAHSYETTPHWGHRPSIQLKYIR